MPLVSQQRTAFYIRFQKQNKFSSKKKSLQHYFLLSKL